MATLRELAVLAKPTRVGSPKAAVRSSRETGLLNPEEAEGALVMADDRNLTAHTYNERIAVAIFGRLPRHLATLEAWLRAMTARMPASR